MHSFKTKLKSIYGPTCSEAKKLFAYGHGYSTINHCMMRLGLSHLRSHLYNYMYNLVNTPYCENEASSHVHETPSHFLLSCRRHSDKRRMLALNIHTSDFSHAVNYSHEYVTFWYV